jgi:hypothetical protein
MVRHGKVKPEQSDDGANQTFGLPQHRGARPNTKPIVRAVLIARAE